MTEHEVHDIAFLNVDAQKAPDSEGPDISGVWWANSYSPKIAPVGGGGIAAVRGRRKIHLTLLLRAGSVQRLSHEIFLSLIDAFSARFCHSFHSSAVRATQESATLVLLSSLSNNNVVEARHQERIYSPIVA